MRRPVLLLAAAIVALAPGAAGALPDTDTIRARAEEAIIYGLPMVMDYAILYEYAVDRASGQFKAPFNEISNEARVFTPADTAVITPNSDTPYSIAALDLRAEPMVLCVPAVDPQRYYSVMLNSQYTYNFGYIGSRATGSDAGCHMVTGPTWSGETPAGIAKTFRSGTEFALAVYRTQLFGPDDIEAVKAVQAGYTVTPLSAHLGTAAPPAASAVDWPAIDTASAKADPFRYLAFLLQFAPAVGEASEEIPLRERLASIGIRAGEPFSTEGWSDAQKAALSEGVAAGLAKIEAKVKTIGRDANGWRISEGAFGTRDMLGGDDLLRATAAVMGILGNDSVEALYPVTRVDGDGRTLDGATDRYTLTFPADGFPPVHAFWSVTMYDGRTQLLVANPIDRYLVNSPMLPDLAKNPDGSITIRIQKDAPTDPVETANWLPAPDGPIYLVMRLYWPKAAALDGSWSPPPVVRVD